MPQENPESVETQIDFHAKATGVAGKVCGNQVVNNYHQTPESESTLSSQSLDSEKNFNLYRLEEVIKNKEQKYDGQLVETDLDFFINKNQKNEEDEEVGLVLDISFAEKEIEIPRPFGKKNYIIFGIKRGELHLSIKNGSISLKKRKFTKDSKEDWLVDMVGSDECPVWKFKAEPSQSKILSGLCQNEILGYIENLSDNCTVIAIFKVKANLNNIEITAQDGLWDNETTSRKTIETKIRSFLKRFVEPTLKDYLNKVELRYDSTSIS